jgi:hypothetical protein
MMLSRVGGATTAPIPLCIQWVKECRKTWDHVTVKHGDTTVFADGAVQEEWRTRMESVGTDGPTTTLQVFANGIERFKRPVADSNQKLLKVEVRGMSLFDDVFEVSREPVGLTLIYTCEYDGFADVTLRLEKANSALPPERLELKVRKHCGYSQYKFLQIFLQSEAWKNRTEVVSQGSVLPHFGLPCSTPREGECVPESDHLEIPVEDARTSFELVVSSEGLTEPPQFQPLPDLSYNRKIVSATVLMPSATPGSNHAPKRVPARSRSMMVRYTCLRKGSTLMMLTLHVLAHKPIDIVWRKKCEEPKAKVGKVLTASQALAITLVVCFVVVVCLCLVFAMTGDISDKPKVKNYKPARLEESDDIELPTRTLGRREVPPEVVYH